MENYIAGTQPVKPAPRPAEQAADILLQELQLLLDQSRQTCDPDNAANLGPNEKSRILCAMAEAITSGAQTIAELEKANNDKHDVTLKVVGKEAFLTDICEMTEAMRELNGERDKAGTYANDTSGR